MPTQPPTCVMYGLKPWASRKKPIARMISVASRVAKTPKTARLTRVLHMSMYVLKIANATRNHAIALGRFGPVSPAANVFETEASRTMIPSDIQKPPYVENAVAPNTFRLRNSHIPASSCTSPP